MATHKREKSTSTKGHYVTNAEILKAFKESKELGYLTNELGRCLMLIATRYSNHPWFNRFTYKEDMIAHAIVILSANWYKFNPEKSNNPFSYYTTATHRAFRSFLDSEHNQAKIKDKLLLQIGANPSFGFEDEGIE